MAWGGPMAQISMLKDRFVIEKQWISLKQFNRVQGVYQLIPGPEATELCIYFGILSNGRLGGILAGLGFILPGALLMLAISYLYVHVGINNAYFQASFKGIQPAVAAMMIFAVYRIGRHAILNQDTRKLDYHLVFIALMAGLQFLLNINVLITIALSALWYFLYRRSYYLALIALAGLMLVAYAIVLITLGFPSNDAVALGIVKTVSPQGLLGLGFMGGLLSVGGAYSAVPFMEVEATVLGHWMTKAQFLDSLALSAIIPAPMVIFSSFVGFIGGQQLAVEFPNLPVVAGEFIGAILCSFGMFVPAFSLTIIGHHWLGRLVHNPKIGALWDGITACVVGLVAITAVRFAKAAVGSDPLASLTLMGTLMTLFTVQHPFLAIFIITIAAMLGQFFYSPANY
jgi:putative chromate ion transporter